MFAKGWDELAYILWFAVAFGLSSGFAIARLCGAMHPSFQAFAHIWVGFLLGVAFVRQNWAWVILAAGLSLVELVMFVWTKLL